MIYLIIGIGIIVWLGIITSKIFYITDWIETHDLIKQSESKNLNKLFKKLGYEWDRKKGWIKKIRKNDT